MAYTKTEWVTGETPLSADNLNNIENGIEAASLAVTPELWTSYSFNSYTATDTGFSWVYVIGKLCIFSLAFQYTADYTPTNTQAFVTGMPVHCASTFATSSTSRRLPTRKATSRASCWNGARRTRYP